MAKLVQQLIDENVKERREELMEEQGDFHEAIIGLTCPLSRQYQKLGR